MSAHIVLLRGFVLFPPRRRPRTSIQGILGLNRILCPHDRINPMYTALGVSDVSPSSDTRYTGANETRVMVRSAERLCQLWLGMVFAFGCTSSSVEDHPINRQSVGPSSTTTQAAAQKSNPTQSSTAQRPTPERTKAANTDSAHRHPAAPVPPSQPLPAVTSEDCADCHPSKVDGFKEVMGRSLYRD